MPNYAKGDYFKDKHVTGSLGDMLEERNIESVIKLIIEKNLAIVKGSEAEKKIKLYIPVDYK